MTMTRLLLLGAVALLGACASTGQTPRYVQAAPQARPVGAEILDARLERADLAFREARLPDAERLYRAIAEAHPSLTEVWVRLGNIYTRQDELDAAIRAYEMALRNDRNEGRAWYNLAVVHLKQSIATLEQAGVALPAGSPYRELIDAQHSALLRRADAGPLSAAARTASRAEAAKPLAFARQPSGDKAGLDPNCLEDSSACAD